MHLICGLLCLVTTADGSLPATVGPSEQGVAGTLVPSSATLVPSLETTADGSVPATVGPSLKTVDESLSTTPASVTDVIDFRQFLSDDPAILNAISAAVPPSYALTALETTLTEHQLQGFNFVYNEGGRLDNNITYQCWSKLKNLCATVTQTDVSCASLGSADDLLVSASNEDILADVSELMDISLTDLQLPAAGDTAVYSEPVVSGQPLEGQEIAPTTSNTSHSSTAFEQQQVSEQPAVHSAPQSDNFCPSRPAQFPFKNSSYPGDPDSDVLPYPVIAPRHSKRSKKSDKPYFFLLTSQEAFEQKQKEKQEKAEKENQKQERLKSKATKLNNKKASKNEVSKQHKIQEKTGISQTANSDLTGLPAKNTKQTKTKKSALHKAKAKPKPRKLKEVQQKSECCFLCGEADSDPPTEEWIQCGQCKSWFHENCANIEQGIFTCENCDE